MQTTGMAGFYNHCEIRKLLFNNFIVSVQQNDLWGMRLRIIINDTISGDYDAIIYLCEAGRRAVKRYHAAPTFADDSIGNKTASRVYIINMHVFIG